MTLTATQDHFELTLARPVTVPAGHHPTLVHLWWRSAAQDDRLVQVYVNDELYDVTAEASQRQMWLVLDRARPHRIELLAVPAEQAWVEQPLKLKCWQPRVNDVAQLTVLRDERLAVDTRVTVSVDGEEMDTGPLWPSEAHRGGFGALFGEGAFGSDAATGPGLGVGELGHGPLGADGTAWRWRRDDLPAGEHALQITGNDNTGQPSAGAANENVTLDRLAQPAEPLRLDNDFTLHWS